MPKLTVVGQDASAAPKVKWDYSTFFVTLNTNQQNYSVTKLRKKLSELFESDDDFYMLFKNRPGTEGGVETVDRDNAKVEMVIEVGAKTKKVHAHVLIRLRHHGRIMWDKPFADEVIQKHLGLDGMYINFKASGASISTLEEYMAKSPAVEQLEAPGSG
jgi:hypothetical protein